MGYRRRSRRRSGNKAPLLGVVIIAVAVLVVVARLDLLPWQLPGSDRAASATEVPSSELQSRVAISTPTATPTVTPTPIPAPVKTTNAPPPNVSALGAVAIDERSGAVLYEKNAHARRAPASITKIVTAIVALENGNISDMVTVKYDPNELVDSTVMGVNVGDRLSLEDLLYGLMLPSGNDAALAIASHIAGSEKAFCDLMNAKMKVLGLADSHFVNAHGLDNKDHYSSAYDMAMVSRYAMQNPVFRKLALAKVHAVTVWRANGTKESYDVFNLNKLLSIYPGADGIKVGYTENALRTIVGSVTKDGHRVFVALMGSVDLWSDSPPIFDYVFKNFKWPSR